MQLADSESSAGGGGGGRSLSSSPAPPSPLSIRVETSLVDVDLAVLKSLDGESVLHHLCQHRLNFRPVVIPLLGLRTPNGNWLAPHQV